MNTTKKKVQIEEPYYAFTWTPKGETINPRFKIYDHLVYFNITLHRAMKNYEFYPELNKSGNLHWHGWYQIKNEYSYYKSVLPKFKYNGFIKIKRIFELEKWKTYCRKDQILMKRILKMDYNIVSSTQYKYGLHSIEGVNLNKDAINNEKNSSPDLKGLLKGGAHGPPTLSWYPGKVHLNRSNVKQKEYFINVESSTDSEE